MPFEKQNIDSLFAALSKSKFRSRFALGAKERNYLQGKGLSAMRQHAREFINKRLAPAHPKNDGRQTPMKNHPVFIAQHATATCCRKCLGKWHGIEAGRKLSDREISYITEVVTSWLQQQQNAENPKNDNGEKSG